MKVVGMVGQITERGYPRREMGMQGLGEGQEEDACEQEDEWIFVGGVDCEPSR